jgi:hypothetical protein
MPIMPVTCGQCKLSALVDDHRGQSSFVAGAGSAYPAFRRHNLHSNPVAVSPVVVFPFLSSEERPQSVLTFGPSASMASSE